MRTAKVKVSSDELSRFSINEMQIDPFWSDVYTAPPKPRRR